MTITMKCDRRDCLKVIPPTVPGGVRLKMGKKEYVFHLCEDCQNDLRDEIKNGFIAGSEWREL